MALFTSHASEDDTVQLYAKTSEDLSETSLIHRHEVQLKKHNRLHTLSLVLHAVWLLVIIVLLVLLLKTPKSHDEAAHTSQQVSDASEDTQNEENSMEKPKAQPTDSSQDVQSKFEEQLKALNSSLILVSEHQQVLNGFLQDVRKQSEEGQTSLNNSLQEVQQDLQTHNQMSNTTLRRFNDQITVSEGTLNRTYQNLKQQLENHELAANDSFTDLNTQQQNATNVLRSEFTDQLMVIQAGIDESVNKTLEYIATAFGGLGDLTGPTTAPTRRLPVYNQERTTANYLYKDNLPPMSAMTSCFWFNGEQGDDRKQDFLISIAVASESNELMIGWNGIGNIGVWIRNSYKELTPLIAADDTDVLWVGWNKHCFTWKAVNQVKWYTDRITNGELELMASVNVSSYTVRSDGHMVLLQEQDSHGGSLDLSQTLPGKLADFNMWDYEMTADQINTLTCGGVGNVASWDTLQQQGTGLVTYEEFPQCEDRVLPVYNQQLTLSHYRYQTQLPAMSRMSTCFWFNGLASDDKNGDFLISIAIAAQQNELIIGWQYSGKMSMYIRGNAKEFPLSAQYDDMNTLWVGWHKHCFTFKAGGKAKWYTDLATSGFVELVSTIDASSDTIRAGGYMTLLQEQDSVGGSFDLSQTVPGKMAEFNMWNYEIAEEDINSDTCGGEGNVASWDTLQYYGSSNITYERFPLCDSS